MRIFDLEQIREEATDAIVFDDDYETLCPWASVVKSGQVWSDELTDAAVELLESEKNNRE